MNITQATALALFNALQSETLARSGGCKYTSKDGKHCIVGQVLTDAGITVPAYGEGEANERRFSRFPVLEQEAMRVGYDLDALSKAQYAWDGRDYYGGTLRPDERGTKGVRNLIDKLATGWHEPIPTPVLETA